VLTGYRHNHLRDTSMRLPPYGGVMAALKALHVSSADVAQMFEHYRHIKMQTNAEAL
jgi:hypothetical protein